MKVLFYILLLCWGCTSTTSSKYVNANNTSYNDVEEIRNIDNREFYSNIIEHYKNDTVGFKKHQTFDEFTMKAKGKVEAEPYVLVKEVDDTIIVKSSDPRDSIRVYLKEHNGIWHNHMEYEMWKSKDYVPVKSEWDKVARMYDRFFYNDTIMEIQKSAFDDNDNVMVFVKTRTDILSISLNEKKDIESLRAMVYKLPYHPDDKKPGFTRYNVILHNDTIAYIPVFSNGRKYDYVKKAYGFWGIQPGIHETYIYMGQDIRNFNHACPNGQLCENDDVVYETADEYPKFHEGINELSKKLDITIENPAVKETAKGRVVVEMIVEKDGSLTNFKIKKSFNKDYEQMAIDHVKTLGRFIPAQLGGVKVRFRYCIPVRFTITNERKCCQ